MSVSVCEKQSEQRKQQSKERMCRWKESESEEKGKTHERIINESSVPETHRRRGAAHEYEDRS